MLRNLITVTLRVLWRQKLYAGINLLGLSLALGLTLLFVLYVRHEYRFDRFHEHADRIVQLNQHEVIPGRDPFGSIHTPPVLADALRESVAGVERVVRYAQIGSRVRTDDTAFDVTMHYTDAGFFDVFSFPLLEGGGEPLADPSHAVVTESLARKVLGGNGPWVGQRLLVQIENDEREMTVAAVAKDPPLHSSVQFELLVPFELVKTWAPEHYFSHWLIVWPETYALLQPGVAVADFDASLAAMYEAYQFDENYGEGALRFSGKPLTEVHLHGDYAGLNAGNASDPVYSRILLGIAGLILLVAAVNYTSLALGRSLSRAREVGLRKVLGAHGRQLRRQFLGESLLLTALAAPLGWMLAELALPVFNRIAGTQLQLTFDPVAVSVVAGLVIVVGLASGMYPAAVLARFRPGPVLKGDARVTGGGRFLRALLVLQFTLAALLLFGALMMGRQLHYMANRDLGYSGEQVVSLRTSVQDPEVADALTNRLEQRLADLPGVTSVAAASEDFGTGWGRFGYPHEDGDFRFFHVNKVDAGYIPTAGLELVAGRNFDPARPDDPRGVIINEALAAQYGWEQPLGKMLPSPEFDAHEVIGVVKDFHFKSLHHAIEPLMLIQSHAALSPGLEDVVDYNGVRGTLLVRLSGDDIAGTLRAIEAAWTSLAPEEPFQPRFVDDNVRALYQQERVMNGVVRISSALALLIAGLGLLGLVSLSVARRTREIGVRKVLGASVPGILTLLAKEFTGLIVLGSLIAWPLGWLAMNRWLEGFAYRAPVHPLLFVAVTAGVLLLAWLTVVLQAWRVAARNPVHALRHE